MAFLASNLALIVLLIVGVLLLVWEAFMPGFGVAGISGIIVEVIAVVCAYTQYGALFAVLLTLAILLVIGLTIFLSFRSAMHGRISKSPLVLRETQDAGCETAAESLKSLVNEKAVTATPLRPGGMVEIGGKQIPAASTGDFLAKGIAVLVTGVSGDHVIVKPVD